MVIEEISNNRKLEEWDEIEWRWSLIDEVKRLLILLLRKQGNRNLMMSEELWMNEKRNPHIIGQWIMNNNKEGWIVLKTVGSIEVKSEFSISIGGNCDEDSIILLLQVHHLINTYSRMDIMEVKILIEGPFFISNRFLIEIDIEINKETKKENHLNHERNEFCILYQYSFGGYDVILLFSIKQSRKNVFNYWMKQSDTTIILFPYRIDYSIDSHKLIELIEILNVDNDQIDIINNHSITILFLWSSEREWIWYFYHSWFPLSFLILLVGLQIIQSLLLLLLLFFFDRILIVHS